MQDLPGGPVVKNPPSNAGDAGSLPGRGTKIPTGQGATKPVCSRACMPQLESQCATTREPTCYN